MTVENNTRINQWFIRGIAIIVSTIFGSLLFIIFSEIKQDQFISGPESAVNFSALANEIGLTFWSYRVFDLLLLFMIIVLTIIISYYLISFKAVSKPNQRQRRRYD